jgi:hypothetical protein
MAVHNVSTEQKYKFYDCNFCIPNKENKKYEINKNASYDLTFYSRIGFYFIYKRGCPLCMRITDNPSNLNLNPHFSPFQNKEFYTFFYNPRQKNNIAPSKKENNKFIDIDNDNVYNNYSNKFIILNNNNVSNKENNKCIAKYIFIKPNDANNKNNDKFIMLNWINWTNNFYSKFIFKFNNFIIDKKIIIIDAVSIDIAKITINELHSFIVTIVQLTNDISNINKIVSIIQRSNMRNIIIGSFSLRTFVLDKIAKIYGNKKLDGKEFMHYLDLLNYIM